MNISMRSPIFYKLFSFYWASSPDSLSITKVKSLNITLLLNFFFVAFPAL